MMRKITERDLPKCTVKLHLTPVTTVVAEALYWLPIMRAAEATRVQAAPSSLHLLAEWPMVTASASSLLAAADGAVRIVPALSNPCDAVCDVRYTMLACM